MGTFNICCAKWVQPFNYNAKCSGTLLKGVFVPREVDVDDDHDVEMPEELQLLQRYRRFAVSLWRVLQVANRPDLSN